MLRKLSRKTKGRTQKKKRKEKIITKFSDDRTRQEKLMNNEREKTLEEKEQGRVFTTDKPNDFLEAMVLWFS